MAKTRQVENSETLQDQGKKVMGRPTKRTPERVQAILDALSQGTPLTHICAELGICDDTVRDWADTDPQLSRDIAISRERGFDAIAMDALRIADDRNNDTIITEDGDEIPNKEWMARSKLRVETRLKLLAKWDPKRYGDKPEIIVNNNNTAASATVINLPPDQEAQLKHLIETTRDKVKIK